MGGPRQATGGRAAYRRGPVPPGAGQVDPAKVSAGVVGDGEVNFRSGAGRGRPL